MKKVSEHEKKSKMQINVKIIAIVTSVLVIIWIGMVSYICIKSYEDNIEISKNKENTNYPERETVETLAPTLEDRITEETIDIRVEQLMNEIRKENNLDENNFYFFYYNIEENKYYFYNENTYFTAASTIKVPVAMLYYDKIAEGKIKLSDRLLYNEDDYESGGGTTAKDYTIGDTVPLSYLLEQSIVNSDNTAFNILIGNIGYKACKEQLTKYTQATLAKNFYTSNIANAYYYYDVLEYLYQNSGRYEKLLKYMKESSEGEYLKADLPQYEVAHKYGLYNEYTHDYGIIYGKNTYLIGVFTKDVDNANALIAHIGQQIVNIVEAEEDKNDFSMINS